MHARIESVFSHLSEFQLKKIQSVQKSHSKTDAALHFKTFKRAIWRHLVGTLGITSEK